MIYVLIGPFPPPLGGVSVFLSRYARSLRRQGHTVEAIDFAKGERRDRWRTLTRLLVAPGRAIFHLNTYEPRLMAALLARPFGKRVVFMDHSGRQVRTLSPRRRWLMQRFLDRVDECVLVGPHLREHYDAAGLRLPANTRVQPAYLPPPAEDEAGIVATYTPETLAFVAQAHPLIIANAFRLRVLDGVDLYGFDLCVRLLDRLRATHSAAGLLLALADIGDHEHFEALRAEIRARGLEAHVHFMTDQRELWPLFARADLFLRPTSSDGDAVSIREALHLGCATVASDVCARPRGVAVFRSRDLDDLERVVRASLAQRE